MNRLAVTNPMLSLQQPTKFVNRVVKKIIDKLYALFLERITKNKPSLADGWQKNGLGHAFIGF